MIHNSCGCTMQGPGLTCVDGKELYAAASRAFQDLFTEKVMIAHDERWIIYSLARLAYIDHLNGWQEGDVKIQRRSGFGMVFTRLSGQWIFQFGTKNDALLVDWLRNRGYQQYVQVKSEQRRDQLLGYYRKYERNEMGIGDSEMSPTQVQGIPEAPYLLKGGMTTSLEHGVVSHIPSSLSIDLKIQAAIRIAMLIANFTSPLTVSDRHLVQQRAVHLLLEHGRVVEPGDERLLQEIIDEAIQQKERLNRLLE